MTIEEIPSDGYRLSSFGGADVLINAIKKDGIINFIDKKLGKRRHNAKYSYGEAMVHWFVASCCGAKRLENIYNVKENLVKHPNLGKCISPDTITYITKELKVENTYFKKQDKGKFSTKGVNTPHEVNDNVQLNRLLVEMSLKLKLLEKNKPYILDYDVTLLPNKISDGKPQYKDNLCGYAPAVACIENIPVYVENRNGDSNAAFALTKTIDKALSLLKEYGITVKTIRSDAAAISEEFFKYCDDNGYSFITKLKTNMFQNVLGDCSWRKPNIEFKGYSDIGIIPDYEYKSKPYRVIALKGKHRTTAFITNEKKMTDEEIARLYQLRGDSENLFRALKNQFSVTLLGHRNIKLNTVFLLIQCLCYSLYKYYIRKFGKIIPILKVTNNRDTFFRKFILIPAIWFGAVLSISKYADLLRGFT